MSVSAGPQSLILVKPTTKPLAKLWRLASKRTSNLPKYLTLAVRCRRLQQNKSPDCNKGSDRACNHCSVIPNTSPDHALVYPWYFLFQRRSVHAPPEDLIGSQPLPSPWQCVLTP